MIAGLPAGRQLMPADAARIGAQVERLRSLETPQRVMRGGSFLNQAYGVRTAQRNFSRPDDRSPNHGFRAARTFHPR